MLLSVVTTVTAMTAVSDMHKVRETSDGRRRVRCHVCVCFCVELCLLSCPVLSCSVLFLFPVSPVLLFSWSPVAHPYQEW